ncbi:MAG: exonuclease domain-containing protein [Bacteroidia bacterium]|nr:exonuclease domain-containing protein [Bacteroidia bacterium]
MYAIIDIETTGAAAQYGKITEIAIVLHDGLKVTETFNTLINPECPIPYQITSLTGISNAMVANAPKFYEVAKQIIRLTEGRIFVAHNAVFDYSFVKEEFKRLGYSYSRDTMCTVKTSRKMIPGHRSYSLGNLCADLGIGITDRHRALGDALATAKLFDILIEKSKTDNFLIPAKSSQFLTNEKIASIPAVTGVYYIYDNLNNLIYIGKSKDIRQRVLTHLNSPKTKKAIEMRDKMADLSWEETGSELVALLLESDEIKKHKPLFNRAQRNTTFNFGLFSFEDHNGYLNLIIQKVQNETNPLTTFSSQQEGIDFMHQLVMEFTLCKKLCNLYKADGECFSAQLNDCHGACGGRESAESYNVRVHNAIRPLNYKHENFYIVDQGRSADEKAIVKIASNRYIGFGYVGLNNSSADLAIFDDCIKKYGDNRDAQRIITSLIKLNKRLQIIPF